MYLYFFGLTRLPVECFFHDGIIDRTTPDVVSV